MAGTRVGITQEFLQELLAADDPHASVDSFEVTTGSGRGDNYTAMMYRVKVHGTTTLPDCEPESWTRSIICKCLPQNTAKRQAFKSDALFKNEIAVYTQALPALLAFQVQSALAPDQKRDSYLQKMQEFVGDNSFFSRMISLVAPHEPLAVLCHGDCWTNNVLFRYSETGDILEVCLIDFQLARYGSPALDLANLLYICTTGELRSSYMQKFLESYRSTLVETLSELGCFDPDLVKSTPFASPNILGEMLHAEMRRCGPFALGLALDMIPICTCDSEQAPDMYDKEDTQSPEGNNTPVWSWNWNDACAKKMTELVMELVDHGGL
ncbi:uncharacterized protein [Anabrus simplex]|uniref:uncharacterized protein isoform X3 n=1 Tax=Anabrus simplex TaxID=316456 RepID=UPI0035A34A07